MHGDDATTDALRSILRSVHLDASLMSRAHLRAPFAVASRALERAVFHVVVQGSCRIALDDPAQAIALHRGDIVLLTRGDSHIIASDGGGIPRPHAVETLSVVAGDSSVPTLSHGGDGPQTRIICGTFALRHAAGGMMLHSLPSVLHAPRSEDAEIGSWLDTTISQLAATLDRGAVGAEAMVNRLTDIVVIHAIQTCVARAPAHGGGWLSALRDERIGRAVAAIHDQPATNWTASTLASRAGMSRSSFFARFSELVGVPPAQYVARWRVWVAAELIDRERLSVGELAARVGYASEDAFSRVFKRIMGVSPVQFRRRTHAPAG